MAWLQNYLVRKLMLKTRRCNNVKFWSEQRRRKDNVVTTLPPDQKTTKNHVPAGQNLESRQLHPVDRIKFDGKLSQWLEILKNLKQTLSDQMQMKKVLTVFGGEGKRSVESISKSKSFYAAALKLLKRHFGNAFYVSH